MEPRNASPMSIGHHATHEARIERNRRSRKRGDRPAIQPETELGSSKICCVAPTSAQTQADVRCVGSQDDESSGALTDTQATWSLIGLAALIAWLLLTRGIWRFLSHPRHLAKVRTDGIAGNALPRVSVIVPARNEQQAVERCLSSLLCQDYPNLEIIAVDDRSTDETGRIMDRLAYGDARLTVIHIDELPDGWLGKNRANAIGQKRATGQWLLFTDGDVIFAESCIRKAIAHAVAERLDYLTLTPGLSDGGFWETAASCCFGVLLSAHQKIWHMRNPLRRDCFCGVGAFGLVRREAYSAIGGHDALRLEVADDLMLARSVKRAGRVGDIMSGRGEITVRWQVGLGGVVRGLEKNGFAGANYSLIQAMRSVLLLLAAGFVPILGIALAPGLSRLAFAAIYAAQAALMTKGAAVQELPRKIGFAFPLMCIVLAYAVLRSTVLAIARGGIYWRDSFYSLDALRRARRPGA